MVMSRWASQAHQDGQPTTEYTGPAQTSLSFAFLDKFPYRCIGSSRWEPEFGAGFDIKFTITRLIALIRDINHETTIDFLIEERP